MKTLSFLSSDPRHARAVFEAGGLHAATLYFDFFPIHVQVRMREERPTHPPTHLPTNPPTHTHKHL